MSLPPELDSRAPYSWWAIFPGVGTADQDPHERVVKLEPGDTVSAIWAGSRSIDTGGGFWSQQYSAIANEFRLLTFQPGEYSIKIVAIYWTKESSVGNPLLDAHAQTLDIKTPFVAPQWVIICGSIIGGLIAYCLLPQFRIHPDRVDVLGMSTAALLSIIVTILLSRIADTQFFIKVSVNDVWGAIAVGFLGNASGTKIIKKFLPETTASRPERPPRVSGHKILNDPSAAQSDGEGAHSIVSDARSETTTAGPAIR